MPDFYLMHSHMYIGQLNLLYYSMSVNESNTHLGYALVSIVSFIATIKPIQNYSRPSIEQPTPV